MPDPRQLITDWYLPVQHTQNGFVYPGPVTIGSVEGLLDLANELLRACQERAASGYEEFVLEEGGVFYRGHRITTIEGIFFTLRKMPKRIEKLSTLGMPPEIAEVLMGPWLNRGGMIMICGETGQGKSTTCAAVIKERMEKYGSFCLTVEDPPEMPLHGVHGKGRCLQTEVQSGNFAEALKGAMRCYPTVGGSMLYVGETRDGETAAEVMRVAVNGHLVLTTIHAQDLKTAVKRLIGMAGFRMSPDEARSMVASALRMVMHQRLITSPGVNGTPDRKRLEIEMVISQSTSSPIANMLMDNQIEQLSNEIDLQQRTLRAKGPSGLLEMWK
jgi:Tfp pilus assembly pilus retraction ATPase PilT